LLKPQKNSKIITIKQSNYSSLGDLMTKKSILSTLLLLSLSTPVFADTNYYQIQEKSGYNTQTQVVDKKQVFTRHQFIEQDFSVWLTLLYKAQAFEIFEQLLKTQKINKRGVVLTDELIFGEKVFENGKVITINDIAKYYPHTFIEKDTLAAMIASGALDANGFAAGITGDSNINFDAINFSKVLTQLKTIKIPIQNEKAKAALVNELFELILTRHREIEVVTQQTTRYQSRHDNMFNGLLETIGGNFLSGIFSPDKTSVNRSGLQYIPQANIPALYVLPVGFAPFPNYGSHAGLWGINGSNSVSRLQGSWMNLERVKSFEIDGKLAWTFTKKIPYSDVVPYTYTQAKYLQIQQNNGTTHYINISIPYLSLGTAMSSGWTSEIDFGLSYSYNNSGRNALGLAANTDWSIPILGWLNANLEGAYVFKPDFGKDNQWDQASLTVGLELSPYSEWSAKVGYRWLASITDTNQEGFSLGISYWF